MFGSSEYDIYLCIGNNNIKKTNIMNFKRDNELLEKVMGSDHSSDVDVLVKKYENLTYDKYSDRHTFYEDVVSDMVNDMGFDYRGIAEKMANEHPTLQQSFMRMCVAFIKEMSEKKYTDGRNEHSVNLAKKIMNGIENDTYLPMV